MLLKIWAEKLNCVWNSANFLLYLKLCRIAHEILKFPVDFIRLYGGNFTSTGCLIAMLPGTFCFRRDCKLLNTQKISFDRCSLDGAFRATHRYKFLSLTNYPLLHSNSYAWRSTTWIGFHISSRQPANSPFLTSVFTAARDTFSKNVSE